MSADPQPLQNDEYFWLADVKEKYQGGASLHYLYCFDNVTPDAREPGFADKGESNIAVSFWAEHAKLTRRYFYIGIYTYVQ